MKIKISPEWKKRLETVHLIGLCISMCIVWGSLVLISRLISQQHPIIGMLIILFGVISVISNINTLITKIKD